MPRYPENTVATLDDFRRCNWKAAISAAEPPGYSSIWQRLSEAANAALDQGAMPEAKVLWLLADACSMMLKKRSINEPFGPFTAFGDKRSAIASDFTDADLALFAEMAPEIDHELVRARIADLLWLRKKPRDIAHALMAIDAYTATPVDDEHWVQGSEDCWERAITLALQLRTGAGNRLSEIEAALLKKLIDESERDGFFCLFLSRTLFQHKLCANQGSQIANILAARGQALAIGGRQYEARSYLEAAAGWYSRTDEKELEADMICAVAEAWAHEAVARASSDQPSHMVAATFYEKSIQALRGVPRTLRATRRVDERIAELHQKLEEAGKASLGEMGSISSGPIDITELVEAARAAVLGKSAIDALQALANICNGVKRKKMEEAAETLIRDYPFQMLFATTQMSRDGRTIAKRPALGERGSEAHRLAVWAEMVKHYNMQISLIVQAQIWPALQTFLLEHRIREADLFRLASQSPLIPHDRATLVGKALFAGFEQDLVTALHLLVPQVENLVRWHLKAAGVKTTTLSSDGIENENGLSTLSELPEFETIFGEDMAFEMRALFCDPFGANLRNEVAHGLLDSEHCQTAPVVYAWWLLLRITFNTYLNATRAQNAAPDATGGQAPPADALQ